MSIKSLKKMHLKFLKSFEKITRHKQLTATEIGLMLGVNTPILLARKGQQGLISCPIILLL